MFQGRSMDELIARWKKDENTVFRGWDFSYIQERMFISSFPWDYEKTAKGLVLKSNSVLDMETGGGEIFSSLAPFPKHAVAYEGYKPNIPLARRRLAPLGVKVVKCTSVDHLPFKNEEFDLILNRHGAINGDEIYRILRNDGILLTQQVTGTDNLQDLVKEFKAKRTFSNITLEEYEKQLRDAGFRILKSRKWTGKQIFKDVGAIAYYLKAIPWAVPGFSVENNLSDLKRLQRRLEQKGKLEFETARFMILAKKPTNSGNASTK